MVKLKPEFEDIGRFIRARRMASNAEAIADLPRRRRRHVPYLTQYELAELVDVSTVVISQIEQGKYPNLSVRMLKRIADVLHFHPQDEMFMLGLHTPTAKTQREVDPAPQWLLDSIAERRHPVFVVSPAYDLMGWNESAEKILGEHAQNYLETGNVVVSVFEIPDMKDYFVDWQEFATSLVSGLRMSYGVHADFREYVARFAEKMCERDDFFRELWEKDDPLMLPTIEKELNHPSLGRLRIFQVITLIVEATTFTMAEWLPADEETRAKLASL